MVHGVALVPDFLGVSLITFGIKLVARPIRGERVVIKTVEPTSRVFLYLTVTKRDGDLHAGGEMLAHPDISVGVLEEGDHVMPLSWVVDPHSTMRSIRAGPEDN